LEPEFLSAWQKARPTGRFWVNPIPAQSTHAATTPQQDFMNAQSKGKGNPPKTAK